jgi:flagellar assembly protein FliH
MSSSRIIKSEQLGIGAVGSFSFQPISHAVQKQVDGESSTSFVPMAIFDASELPSTPSPPRAEPQKSDEPPSVTLLEEEFHRRLTEAFNNGLIEGKSLAERGLVNVFRSLRTATEDVQSLREKVMRESEDDLIDLIMLVARKVILREVAMDRGILLSVVRTAIATLSERCEITIRLHPDDYILVTSGPDDSFRKELLTERMRLKSDPAVLQGFCQIDSEMGTLDAGIDAQLDEIFRHLLEKRAVLTDNDQ